MKFSEISAEEWGSLQPYLDTCLLPVTGLMGIEQPFEATEQLEKLRDIMDLIEIPFKGRVVTYPAMHFYTNDEASRNMLEQVCKSLKKTGFKHVLIATAQAGLDVAVNNASMVLRPEHDGSLPESSKVAVMMRELWNGQAT